MTRHRSLRSRLAGIPARQLLLLLDFDGTLAPIVLRPDRAMLPAPVRAVLLRLVRLMPVVVVSGRALREDPGHAVYLLSRAGVQRAPVSCPLAGAARAQTGSAALGTSAAILGRR